MQQNMPQLWSPRQAPKGGGRFEADRLLAVGLRYRERHERSASSLKSCLAVSDGARVQRSMWETALLSQRRAALANQVRRLDIAVGTRLGAEAVEDDDEAFAEKMQGLTALLGEQMVKGAELDQLIRQKLGGLGYEF